MVSLFIKKSKTAVGSKLDEVVLRGFGGGLNVVDDDTNVEPKYQVVLNNFMRTTSGAQRLRYGTRWFADIAGTITGNIIDMKYFNNRLVVVSSTGQIATCSNAGALTKIWDSTIAAALPGAPAGWSALTAVNFVPWKDQLIIHNGIDKPIILSAAFAVTYLQDLATGSNVNTPIGKYGCIAANYHCVAGIPSALTTVYLSAKGTAGVFPGDPAPNDAISIDVGAFAPSGAPEILGIVGFRTKLIVFFRGQSLIIQLGQYDTAATPNHVPAFDDEMPQFGLINHRSIVPVQNDLHFGGYDGMASAKRNLFSGTIVSKFLSTFIEPLWRAKLAQASVSNPFLVHSGIEHTSMMFLNDTDGTVFGYQANEQLQYEAWTKLIGLPYKCGTSSFLDRVFIANRTGGTTRIYQLGNGIYPAEDYHADRLGDRDGIWAQSTVYTAGTLLVGASGVSTIDVNGGFENGTVPGADGWNFRAGTGSADFFGGVRSGLKCALLTPVAALPANLVSDEFLVQDGKDYTLSGYVIGGGGTGSCPNGLTFGMEFLNESGAVLQTSYVSNNGAIAAAYTLKTATFTAPALSHTARIFVMLLSTATVADILVDDITMTTTGTFGSTYQVLLNHTSPNTGTLADDVIAHPTRWALWSGDPISFDFELPWVDGRSPMRTKQLRFISIDARGSAQFVFSVFVDFITSAAAAAMTFIGNDGTGTNKANDPQLYDLSVKFKTMKSVITGSTREPLTIAGIRYLFSKGRFRR